MILIVDDRPENILPLKKILELHRFQVDTAESGEEALKKSTKKNVFGHYPRCTDARHGWL